MPALANSSVGSFSGTTGLDGTNVCPCFLQKKSMNCWRMSFEDGMGISETSPGARRWASRDRTRNQAESSRARTTRAAQSEGAVSKGGLDDRIPRRLLDTKSVYSVRYGAICRSKHQLGV